jgi:hypothetical protein
VLLGSFLLVGHEQGKLARDAQALVLIDSPARRVRKFGRAFAGESRWRVWVRSIRFRLKAS